ncbi:hypothetical protein V8D89_004438, partial [Ganoderma adspersum]
MDRCLVVQILIIIILARCRETKSCLLWPSGSHSHMTEGVLLCQVLQNMPLGMKFEPPSLATRVSCPRGSDLSPYAGAQVTVVTVGLTAYHDLTATSPLILLLDGSWGASSVWSRVLIVDQRVAISLKPCFELMETEMES